MKKYPVNKNLFDAIIFLIIFCIIVLLATFSVNNWLKHHPLISNGKLERSYTLLLKDLDEEPEDITAVPYEPHIPNIINEDIKKMLSSKKDFEIYYSNDDSSYIRIVKDDTKINNICMIMSTTNVYLEKFKLINNISMYKNNGNIVIYGTPGDGYSGYRELVRYEIEPDGGSIIENYLFDDRHLDLYGTEYAKNTVPDRVDYFDSDVTLIRVGKDFMFYRLGKQIGETFTFPGDEISKFYYSYILDNKNDIYYMYYDANKDSPWVEFTKIDSNVTIPSSPDYYSNKLTMISKDGETTELPFYFKNSKKYIGVPDLKTYKAYHRGTHNYKKTDFTLNFNVQAFELCDKNVEFIEIHKYSSSISDDINWYFRYYYKCNNNYIYDSKRVNGLDSYIAQNFIPEEKLKKFDGMKINLNEKDKIIQELRDLYAEYQDYEYD